MRVELIAVHQEMRTVVCTSTLEEVPTAVAEAPHGYSVAWFIGPAPGLEPGRLQGPVAAIVASSPSLIHVFGDAAKVVHDLLDATLHEADHFAVTLWSEQFTPNEAVFDIFRVDFPVEEMVDAWSARFIILDESVSGAQRATLIRLFQDPDRSIKEYLAEE